MINHSELQNTNILIQMINALLSPFKKNKMRCQNDPKDEKLHPQFNQQQISIQYHDENTNTNNIIYTMPQLSHHQKIFHPQDWNIKKFEIGRPLGRGKFGHVYLARQKQTKHIVAIKVLSKKQIINSDVVGQIRREIQIHTHLDHPNVLKMHGFFFDERKIYYIIEYASGGELYKLLIKERKFPQKRVARYIKQMASALQYIHQCNVFHRDIKPQNILVCDGDELKISDFGWSVRALTTKRRTMCGTIDYLCPEIIEHRYYDSSVDIWALGVLTYQLATGSAPFYNKDRQIQYKNVRNVIYNEPCYLSEGIKDFIRGLLKKNPKERMTINEALQHPWLIENTEKQN